jgi:hypothetical protein
MMLAFVAGFMSGVLASYIVAFILVRGIGDDD